MSKAYTNDTDQEQLVLDVPTAVKKVFEYYYTAEDKGDYTLRSECDDSKDYNMSVYVYEKEEDSEDYIKIKPKEVMQDCIENEDYNFYCTVHLEEGETAYFKLEVEGIEGDEIEEIPADTVSICIENAKDLLVEDEDILVDDENEEEGHSDGSGIAGDENESEKNDTMVDENINTEKSEAESEEKTTLIQHVKPFVVPACIALGGFALSVLIVLFILKLQKQRNSSESEKKMLKKAAGTKKKILQNSDCLHEVGTRNEQQDSYYYTTLEEQQTTLAIVADGMGGLADGKVASTIVIKECLNYFGKYRNQQSPYELLLGMVRMANQEVWRQLRGTGGATVVIALIQNNKLYYISVGDSRIYLYRNGGLLQLNREHVYENEIARSVINSGNSIKRVDWDPQKKRLTSYVGIGNISSIDRNREAIELKDRDKVMLCSDGIYGTLTQEEMEEALSVKRGSSTEKMNKLIVQKNKAKQDNYTALILY